MPNYLRIVPMPTDVEWVNSKEKRLQITKAWPRQPDRN